jgi:hypothetical protein
LYTDFAHAWGIAIGVNGYFDGGEDLELAGGEAVLTCWGIG